MHVLVHVYSAANVFHGFQYSKIFYPSNNYYNLFNSMVRVRIRVRIGIKVKVITIAQLTEDKNTCRSRS